MAEKKKGPRKKIAPEKKFPGEKSEVLGEKITMGKKGPGKVPGEKNSREKSALEKKCPRKKEVPQKKCPGKISAREKKFPVKKCPWKKVAREKSFDNVTLLACHMQFFAKVQKSYVVYKMIKPARLVQKCFETSIL